MFGTEIVAHVVTRETKTLAEVQAIGSRVVGMRLIPDGVALPCVYFYPLRTEYPDQGLGLGTNMETVWVVIAATCEGTSSNPIRPVANALVGHFSDLEIPDEEYDDERYQLTFTPESEIPEEMTISDGRTFWRRLGTMYRVEITRGG